MHNNAQKVLQICSYYVGSHLYQNLFDAVERQGLKEDIYVFTHKGNAVGKPKAINVYLCHCYNKWERYIFSLKHKRVVDDAISRFNFEDYYLSHAHSLFSNGYVAHQINRMYGLPYVVAVRNTDINLFFQKMIHLRPLGLRIMLNAEKIIFISKPYKEETIRRFIPSKHREYIAGKSIVIPNGVDSFWHQNKIQLGKERDPGVVKLLHVGNIDRNKNVETTINACKILISQGLNINFTVVGKIKNQKLKTLISHYPFIRHIPFCTKENLINHYRKAHILVMPSKNETFGLVYAEAMTQSLPVIYTRGQGFDGQFKEGEVGYSVNYNSPNEIAQRIKDILVNYNAISSMALTKSYKFDWDLIAGDYLEIYKKL